MKNSARHSTSCLARDLDRSCMDVQHRPLVSIRPTQHSKLPLRPTSFSILFHTCQAQLQDLVLLSGRLGFLVPLLKSLFSISTLPCRLRLGLLARYAREFEIKGNEMGTRDSSQDREELAVESKASDVHSFYNLRTRNKIQREMLGGDESMQLSKSTVMRASREYLCRLFQKERPSYHMQIR